MNTWDNLRSLTSKFTGIKPNKLKKESRLEIDLGISGDDAVEFMDEFFDQFPVDSAGFEISRYFEEEGFDPIGLSILIRKIFKIPIPKKSKHELTLGDLEQWINRGYWVDPEKET